MKPDGSPYPENGDAEAGADLRQKGLRKFRRDAAILFGIIGISTIGTLLSLIGAPSLASLAALCYGLGMRHACDADHIASIDNVTRKLLEADRIPASVGFFFALGHSAVVVLTSAALCLFTEFFKSHIDSVSNTASIVSSAVSGSLLLLVGAANLAVAIRIFRQLRTGVQTTHKHVASGFIFRACPCILRSVTKPVHMITVGFIFGLSFDTSTQVALFGVVGMNQGLKNPAWVMLLPIFFTCGMVLVDTLNGIAMGWTYATAQTGESDRLVFNLYLTLSSCVIALIIGTVNILSLVQTVYNLSGSFWDAVATLTENYNSLGFAVVGFYVVSFAGFFIYSCYRRVKGSAAAGNTASSSPLLQDCKLGAELDVVEQLIQESKFFDAVQRIGTTMNTFEADILAREGKSLEPKRRLQKTPEPFLALFLPTASGHEKQLLSRMFKLRGDVLVGLGATQRALIDYSHADRLRPDAELEVKQARLSQTIGNATVEDGKVPCSIITGFLGSGKTTLLNNILKEHHGKRIAVIENEFGEVGIDDALVGGTYLSEENIIEMNNGCICCTIRGDLIVGLKNLLKNSREAGKPLHAIIIETTGLADPSPVAQTFFADEFVQRNCRLDGILTVVDAKHIIQQLEEEKPPGVENEAVEQIAFADRVLLNKCDLVDEQLLDSVERRIRTINPAVPIRRSTRSLVDMSFILGIRAFSLDKVLAQEDEFLLDGVDHQHDPRISSVGIDVPGEVDEGRVQTWMAWLLKERGVNIFRSKGILAIHGQEKKFVFHTIHMLFSSSPLTSWDAREQRRCKIIFIGKHLDREELMSGFMACMVQSL